MRVRSPSNFGTAVLLSVLLAPSAGLAQQQSIDGAYRGSLVCEHMPGTLGILRAPFDMTVDSGNVVAARPIFNRRLLVAGTEIATGTVGADGALHLTASWVAAGGSVKATFNGTLAATGGTLTGTEVWTRSAANGGNASRPCYGAFVKAPPQER
jgi:hypothetical protein